MNSDKVKTHRLKIATRSSPLALIQADYVKKNLERQGFSSELCQIKTTGDLILDKPLHEIGGKGLFIKELEKSLLRQETDLAVHSLKDLPCKLDSQFKFVAYLSRTYFHDILVVPKDGSPLSSLLEGETLLSEDFISQLPSCKIATGSLRRKALIQRCHPKIEVLPIRGNINTRLAKLKKEALDGLILSEASLARLKIPADDFVFYKLDPVWFVPCTAQGVIVVESLAGFEQDSVLAKISCEDTKKACELERAILASLGGSCLLPIGIYCRLGQGVYEIYVVVLNESGSQELRYKKSFNLTEGQEDIVQKVKLDLYEKNINEILLQLGIEGITS